MTMKKLRNLMIMAVMAVGIIMVKPMSVQAVEVLSEEDQLRIAAEHGYGSWEEFINSLPEADFNEGITNADPSNFTTVDPIGDYQTWLSVNYYIPGLINDAQYDAIMSNINSGKVTLDQAYADPLAYATTQKATVKADPVTQEPVVTKTEEPVSKTAKATEEITLKPTCTEKGELTKTSSDGIVTKEELPAMGHEYEIQSDKVANCTEAGLNTYTCINCGDVYTEEVAALGHSYEEAITKEATCTEAGEKTFTCKVCGDTYTEEISALGHKAGEWEITKKAALFTNGEQVKTCEVCGEVVDTQVIASTIPFPVTIISALALIVIPSGAILYKRRKNAKKPEKPEEVSVVTQES